MGQIKIVLPKHKWDDSLVAKQLGSQYFEGSTDSHLILNAVYRLTRSIDKTGALAGMTPGSVWYRLKKWGFETGLGSENFWSASEDDFLRRFYPQIVTGRCSSDNVAKKMNRSIAAINCRANELGITGNIGRKPQDKTRSKQLQWSWASEPTVYQQLKFHWPWTFNPHPKGMLGKNHTQATKDAISDKNTGKVVPIERIDRQMKTKLEKYGSLAPPNVHGSWKSAWREIGGKRHFFRSAWEANYARYLEFLKVNGNIKDWEHEPHTFWFTGIKRGCVSYLPDFRVTNPSGSQEFHEVKGWMDDRSSTKIKRMAKYFPDIKLVIIDSNWFKRNKPQLKGLIPGWETIKAS